MSDQIPQTLPEYSNNPLIAGLPFVKTQREIISVLANRPSFDPKERSFPAHLRKHCIVRLDQYFEPLERHIRFFERFDMVLRQGYRGRNPLTSDYILRLQNSHDRIRQTSLYSTPLQIFENTAQGFALLGVSGIGKTTTLNRTLPHYNQIIEHTFPHYFKQIVWLRLDCPAKGGPAQLCRSFFYAVDRLIGTNYQAKYAGKARALDEMTGNMAHVANLHAIGALIIDEIQFLISMKSDGEAILKFFVTLVNTIGIPVILVGTNSAIPLLQRNFKEARRGVGLGTSTWDAFENNSTWQHLVKQLWEFQWTNTYTALTDEIKEVLYDESQGIVDILIKLFMMVQMRVIAIQEVKGGPEVISPALIRRVAKDELKLVSPMLDALRKKDMKALQRFDDLMPFQSHFDKIKDDALHNASITAWIPPKPEPLGDKQDDIGQQLMASLNAMNIEKDIASVMVNKAIQENPSGDALLLMTTILQEMKSPAAAPKKPSVKPLKLIQGTLNPKDLRGITESDTGEAAYNKLLAAGFIRSPFEEVFA